MREKLATLDLVDDPCKKFVLRYSTTALTDITFHELTEKLLCRMPRDDKGKERFIIDLSFNGITEASVIDLQKWATHDAIAYVSINGNPNISKRNIKKICHAIATLTDADQEKKKAAVREAFRKIVFLPSYYINTAKRRVKIYKDLEEKGYLPRDWDIIQKEYYKVISNTSDLMFSEEDFLDPLDEAASAEDLA